MNRILLLVVLFFLVSGCNFYTPADPEDKAEESVANPVAPENPGAPKVQKTFEQKEVERYEAQKLARDTAILKSKEALKAFEDGVTKNNEARAKAQKEELAARQEADYLETELYANLRIWRAGEDAWLRWFNDEINALTEPFVPRSISDPPEDPKIKHQRQIRITFTKSYLEAEKAVFGQWIDGRYKLYLLEIKKEVDRVRSGSPRSSTPISFAVYPPRIIRIVTFNKNGGDIDAMPISQTTTYGGTVTLPTPPTRTGYTFAGWNNAMNGSGSTFSGATAVTDNMTAYAVWIKE